MLAKLRNYYKRINNNKGMSIVTVIIAIGFVLLLVNVLLLSSAINFKMRNVNVYAKDSFYSAEVVLDEINAGLQQMVSDGLSSAYSEVLASYDLDETTSDEKNELVKGRFYEYIKKMIGLPGDSDTYIAMPVDMSGTSPSEGLYRFVKSSTRWNETGDVNTEYGAFIRSSKNTVKDAEGYSYYTGVIKDENNKGMVLKDLVVYYRDSNGFVSSVKTDIRLVYPELNFDNPVMPEISNYSFITDTALEVKNGASDKGSAPVVTIGGNSFAYKVDTTGTRLDYKTVKDGDEKHIVATSLNLKNGGITTYDGETLWVDDITAYSSNVTLDGYTYIQDDLNFKGKDCVGTLKGYYIGYGNSLTSSKNSSAILVNGKNTKIDMSAIKRLNLAGHAYVGTNTKTSKGEYTDTNKKIGVTTDSTDKSESVEVYFGSSISAKSDQLMYMVPAECIGVNEAGLSMFNKNPLTYAEYNIIRNDDTLRLVGIDKPVSSLGSVYTLGDFMKDEEDFKTVFVRPSGSSDTLVYFYMHFKDDDAANLYFAKYYGVNKESVDKYMKIYLDAITIPSSSDLALRLNIASNIVADMNDIDGDGKKDRQTVGYIKVPGSEYDSIKESFDADNESYTEQFDGYCTKLTPNMEELTNVYLRGSEYTIEGTGSHFDKSHDNKALFNNLINEEMLKEMDGNFEIDGNKAIIKDGNVTVSDSKVHLVVATGDVTLTGSSFEGLIIARGKIIVPSGNFEFKPNDELVNECMFIEDEETHVYSVADVFRDMDEVRYVSKKKNNTEEISLEKLVVFENWTKSVDVSAHK